MKADRFIFYRSFYEAISMLPPEARLEMFDTLTKYALDGLEPSEATPQVRAMFCLMQPILDKNSHRASGGRAGASHGKKGGRPRKTQSNPAEAAPSEEEKMEHGMANTKTPSAASNPFTAPIDASGSYEKTFEEEVQRMKADEIWLEQGVCIRFRITKEEALRKLDEFLPHLHTFCQGEKHPSYIKAQRHFCSWMLKQNTNKKHILNETKQADRYAHRRGADSEARCPEDYTDEI